MDEVIHYTYGDIRETLLAVKGSPETFLDHAEITHIFEDITGLHPLVWIMLKAKEPNHVSDFETIALGTAINVALREAFGADPDAD